MGVTLLSERQPAEAIKTPAAGSERATYALSTLKDRNAFVARRSRRQTSPCLRALRGGASLCRTYGAGNLWCMRSQPCRAGLQCAAPLALITQAQELRTSRDSSIAVNPARSDTAGQSWMEQSECTSQIPARDDKERKTAIGNSVRDQNHRETGISVPRTHSNLNS